MFDSGPHLLGLLWWSFLLCALDSLCVDVYTRVQV